MNASMDVRNSQNGWMMKGLRKIRESGILSYRLRILYMMDVIASIKNKISWKY